MNAGFKTLLCVLCASALIGCIAPSGLSRRSLTQAGAQSIALRQSRAMVATPQVPQVVIQRPGEIILPLLYFNVPVNHCQLFSGPTPKGPWSHVDDLEELPDGGLRVARDATAGPYFVLKKID